MANAVTPEFLSHLKALYPASASEQENPWAFVTAVALSASNLPEAIPLVFKHALKDLPSPPSVTEDENALLLVRKLKDALFKSGLLCGYPKVINALTALHNALPDNLRDTKPLRDSSTSTEELSKAGRQDFERTYGDKAVTVQTLLDDIYPDQGFFSTTFAYGYVYSFSGMLSHTDTSFAIIAALIASDVPRQIEWHLHGAIRNGANVAEVKAVRQIAIEAARIAGTNWKNEIPDFI